MSDDTKKCAALFFGEYTKKVVWVVRAPHEIQGNDVVAQEVYNYDDLEESLGKYEGFPKCNIKKPNVPFPGNGVLWWAKLKLTGPRPPPRRVTNAILYTEHTYDYDTACVGCSTSSSSESSDGGESSDDQNDSNNGNSISTDHDFIEKNNFKTIESWSEARDRIKEDYNDENSRRKYDAPHEIGRAHV